MTDKIFSRDATSRSPNLIAEYETAEGRVEIHGLRGGFTVFCGERLLQKDLGAREMACYFAHVLQAAHHRLSTSRSEIATHPIVDGDLATQRAIDAARSARPEFERMADVADKSQERAIQAIQQNVELERDAARYRWLRSLFKEHNDGWTINETVWGAPSLDTFDGCIDVMRGEP